MRTIMYLVGVTVGAIILMVSLIAMVVYPEWGWVFGVVVIATLTLAVAMESRTQPCARIVAWYGDRKVYCVRPSRHHGECAAPLTALESIHFYQSPF